MEQSPFDWRRLRATIFLGVLLVLSVPAGAWGIDEPLAANVLRAPTPIRGDDGTVRLTYELHITNVLEWPLRLAQIEISDAGGRLQLLTGDELAKSLRPLGRSRQEWEQRPTADRLTLEPGMSGLVYLWVALPDRSEVRGRLQHRIQVIEGDTPASPPRTIELSPIVLPPEKPLHIGPPVRGGPWLVSNGPSNTSPHRRYTVPSHGRLQVFQRYAIDYMKLGRDGLRFSGDGYDNRSYFTHGEEAIAVADAVIASVREGLPENVPAMRVPTEMRARLDTLCGNMVVLDLGSERYAIYCHLLPATVRVKPHQKVRRGDVLGNIGNTGNSIQPHLHFELADSMSIAEGDGLPYLQERFEWAGKCPQNYPYNKLEAPPCEIQATRQVVRDAMPLNESILFFP